MLYMRKLPLILFPLFYIISVFTAFLNSKQFSTQNSGCEPLTPDDIAEIIVFMASRRQNVVVADTLVFPNHQVRQPPSSPAPSYHADGIVKWLMVILQAAATVLHKRS